MTVEAEQAVLGGVMLRADSFWKVADIIGEADFQQTGHGVVFSAMRELIGRNEPVDAITLGNYIEKEQLTGRAATMDYLIGLASNTPGVANIRAWAEIVAKTSESRRLAIAATRIANCQGYEEALRLLSEVRPKQSARLLTAKDGAKLMYAAVVSRYDAPDGLLGVSTTIEHLDLITGGFEKAKVHWVAARPSMGKTAFAVQVAINAGRCMFFSLEMTAASLIERACANIGRFPHRWMRFPKEAESEPLWSGVFMKAIKEINELPLIIDDASMLTVEDVCARARQAHMSKPLDMVVVDHFGRMRFPGKQSEVIELGDASKVLSSLAKDLDVPVVVLYQLNRSVTDRAGNEPAMSDLRGSGKLEEDADSIILLHRPEYYQLEPKGYIKFIVAKARDGATGEAWALARLSHMRMESCESPVNGEPQYQKPTKGGFQR